MSPPQAPPAVEGWFEVAPEPRLLGSRCPACGTYSFPAETVFCRNPACESTSFEPVGLSRRGRIWSYTVNHYAAPPPAVNPEPFEPYAVAAVELTEERMVVLGKVAAGTDLETLRLGDEVEVVVEPIIPGADEFVWKWKPVSA